MCRKCREPKKSHKDRKCGPKNCCGDNTDSKCCFAKAQAAAFENLRRLFPDEPDKLGSSTSLQAKEYKHMPFQNGGGISGGLKLEYHEDVNKYSLPGLKVKTTFDLVPSVAEAGSMNSEILNSGFDGGLKSQDRKHNSHWFGVTQDEENFYYSVWGGTLFGALFGNGTSGLFVARKRKDASLVWVRSVWDYSLDIPKQFSLFANRLARVALAVYKDRLYVTTLASNIGPQLICMDKKTGAPIWTMAYYLPESLGTGFLVASSPSLGSKSTFDGTPYAFQSIAFGDLNINVTELENGKPSVFVGVSSFQNAVNPASFGGFPEYFEQGQLVRVDDLGITATRVWSRNTCAPKLVAGDTISSTGAPEFNPFRPGSTQVYVFREVTSVGDFPYASILDYNGANPGYIPQGYPTDNNLTTPAVKNDFIFGGDPVITEADIPALYRSAFPGVGANPVIYQRKLSGPGPGLTFGPVDITTVLAEWNAIRVALAPGEAVKIIYWTYMDQTTINNFNSSVDTSNEFIRYIAALPDNYVIENSQVAKALNYYGNSVWGQAPIVDVKRNLVYFGSGQAHGCPVDELLFYENPGNNSAGVGPVQYLQRKQEVIDTEYQYARLDSSTDVAPFSTLADVNAAKEKFEKTTLDLSLSFSDKSPRGNMSYSDSIIAADLDTGVMEFGFRAEVWDAVTFIADDPTLDVIRASFLDGDMSSGINYFDNIRLQNGEYGSVLASMHKGSTILTLDISGYNPSVVYDNTNILQKGVVPHTAYAGPDGALGGSNYGQAQDGGSRLIWGSGNNAPDFGSFSETYNTGFLEGFEFHVTRDGRVFNIHNSFIAAFDVGLQEFVWETNMGALSHPNVSVYNGVVYAPIGDGILLGLDVQKGEPIWKTEVFQKYGMEGISAPSFTNGQAVWICNYVLNPFTVAAFGQLGKTGLLLDVDPCLLVTPEDTVKSLVGKTQFASFDVVPKAFQATVQQNLVLNQIVTHQWDCDGNLTATHCYNSEKTVLNMTALDFIYSSQQIVFDNFQSENGYRYVSLTFLNRKTYVLVYQILQEGEWVNYEATLQFDGCNTNAPVTCPVTNRAVSAHNVENKKEFAEKLAVVASRIPK